MAENKKLEAFLASEAGDNRPAPQPQEPPKPEPQQSPPAEPKEPTAPPEPQQEADDEEQPREARIGEPVVPREALLDERAKRQDWKEKAVRAEALAAEREKQAEDLRKRIEALEKRQQAPPQPQQQQPGQQFQFTPWEVDPVRRQQEELLNHKFDQSESFARYKLGDEVVDKLIADFAEMTAQNPALRAQLFMQRDPFGWAHKEVERQRLLREVGDDPTSYEQKLRAKWEAEMAARQPPQVALPQNTPPPNMPPSLANVRSAAPRTAQAWSGPLSDQAFAQDMRARRMATRNGHS